MALNVALGSYTGNGATSGTRAITGVGFQPKVVFVWSNSASLAVYPCFMWDTLLSTRGVPTITYTSNNGDQTGTSWDRFSSLDSDGFTIANGTNSGAGYKQLNANADTFYYCALGGDDVYTSSFTGNATDNRSITGVGFQPIFVLAMGLGNTHQITKFDSSGAASDNSQLQWAGSDITNAIQALESDGFQVGTNTSYINNSGTVYPYFCIKAGAQVYQSEYTGNATDNRNITGVGFAPEFIYMKSAGAHLMVQRGDDPTGDNTKYSASSGFVTNHIQSMDSDGFQVGTDTRVNASSTTYRYLTFTSVGDTVALKSINGVLKANIKSWNGVILE